MRPYPITVLCILLFCMGASRLISAVGAVFTDVGGFTLFGLLLSSVALLSYYGLWRMRRWSVVLFVAVWVVTVALQSFVYAPPTFFEQLRYGLTVAMLPVYLVVVLPHWRSMQSHGPRDQSIPL